MLKLILLTTLLLFFSSQTNAVKPADKKNPVQRKDVTFTRAELLQEYPLMDIKCGIQIIELDVLIYAPKHVISKPNRYLFADWRMGLNELLCEFKRTSTENASLQ